MAVEKNAPLDPMALEIAAPFVNKFQILVAGGNVRVAFAEGFANQPSNYRSAVVMSLTDARDLAIAIIESIPTPPGLMAELAKSFVGGAGIPKTGLGAAGLDTAETPVLLREPKNV